jgi:hypothetical protein
VVGRGIARTAILLTALGAAAAGQTTQTGDKAAKAGDKPAKPPTAQQTKTLNLSAYVELLRSDIRTQKVAIITEMMRFTEAEDAAFWPIYREYDLEMAKLGDERVALIAEYAANYPDVSDAVADKLATKALELEAKRQAAKARCYEKVKAVLSPKSAMRFLQIEHQLLLLIDLQISASLPTVD